MTTTRGVAIGGLALAVLLVGFLLLGGGRAYRVDLRLVDASQLVKGNLVQVAGQTVGTVRSIELADDNVARVRLEIDGKYAPLRRGTFAVVRQASLSGVANRYVDLNMGPADGEEIDNGGVITTAESESQVNLDQLFNTFDEPTRKATQRVFRGFGEMVAGREEQANEALRYLNPALSSSSMLFAELNRNEADFERFIVETAQLVGDVSDRGDDLTRLVDGLATTMGALNAQRAGLAESIDRLPDFMRRANTTFVNLRATLDDLDPLVETSRPVVRQLRPLLAELRPFARDARPTVRDLSRTIRRPGARNDLVELLRAQPAVSRVANDPVEANGAQREGAFPATRRALAGGTTNLGFLRPYAPELVGWFDDFSTSGVYDALGGFSRAGLAFSAFTFTPALNIVPVPPELRDEVLAAGASLNRNNRCPGSVERDPGDNSTPYRPSPDFNCDPTQVPVGP